MVSPVSGIVDPNPLGALDRESVAVLLLDPSGRILHLNAAARKALSRLGVEAPRRLEELPPELQAAFRSRGGEGAPPRGRWVKLLKGMWGYEVPVRELDPEWMRGMVQAEQMAAVGQLAATVAQEIGGPNTAIQVAVDRLLEGALEKEEARAALRQLLTQTERISRLTRQLISLADPGKARLAPVDPGEIAESACELMGSSFHEREIRLACELQGAKALARADRNHLLQVLVNLLLNARNALQSWSGDRLVRVRTEVNTDRVYLHVEDSGPGVPPEDVNRIFLPFVSTTGGTGMGLFLTRQLLVEQGGGIRVVPRNAMGGATFTAYLERLRHD